MKPEVSSQPTHLLWGATSLVFGLFLIYFGNQQHLFAGEDRWLAAGVLALAWLSMVATTGFYYRHRPAAAPKKKKP